MKQYYLICDESGQYKFQEAAPQNKHFIVLIIALNDQQKRGFDTLINEKNTSLKLLELAAKMRAKQQLYSKLVNKQEDDLKQSLSDLDCDNNAALVQLLNKEFGKASDKLGLALIASEHEKQFDQELKNYERNFGYLLKNEEQLPLF